MSLLKNVFEINIFPPAPLKGVDRELLNYLGITDNLSPSLFYFWNFCTQINFCFAELITVSEFSFFMSKVLKTKYPNKDWAQVRGRLLGLCNLTTEDASLNKALNKVCLSCIPLWVGIFFYVANYAIWAELKPAIGNKIVETLYSSRVT